MKEKFKELSSTCVEQSGKTPHNDVCFSRWSSSSCASGSMVVVDSLKDDDDKDIPLTIFDSNNELRLPGSVDIRPPRGILQVIWCFYSFL